MNKRQTRATPKLFHTSYQPPKPASADKSPSTRAVVIIVIIFVGLYLLGRLPVFQLKQVDIKGDATPEITGQLNRVLGKSIFSSQVAQVAQQIKRQNLSLQDIQCHRGLPNTLRCTVTARQPAIVWKHGEKEYWVDKNGLVYSERLSKEPTLLIVEDKGSTAPQIGTVIASGEIVSSYQNLAQQSQQRSVTINHLSVADSLYQFTATISNFQTLSNPPGTAASLSVLMNVTTPIENQLSSLVAALQQKGSQISERVDVRVPGYVYYK